MASQVEKKPTFLLSCTIKWRCFSKSCLLSVGVRSRDSQSSSSGISPSQQGWPEGKQWEWPEGEHSRLLYWQMPIRKGEHLAASKLGFLPPQAKEHVLQGRFALTFKDNSAKHSDCCFVVAPCFPEDSSVWASVEN